MIVISWKDLAEGQMMGICHDKNWRRAKVMALSCHGKFGWGPGWQDWLVMNVQRSWRMIGLSGHLRKGFSMISTGKEDGMYHPWSRLQDCWLQGGHNFYAQDPNPTDLQVVLNVLPKKWILQIYKDITQITLFYPLLFLLHELYTTNRDDMASNQGKRLIAILTQNKKI